MRQAMEETERRRAKQIAYNQAHGITPKTIQKKIADIMESAYPGGQKTAREYARVAEEEAVYARLSPAQLAKKLSTLEDTMYQHARDLEFEEAAKIRDEIKHLKDIGLLT